MRRDPKVFHLLQQAHSALFRASDQLLRARLGIGTAQQAILFALSKSDGATLSALADRLGLTKSSLSGLIDRMEKAKLVRRVPNPHDARSALVRIEAKGRDCVAQSLPETKRINSALLAPFDAEERAVIERFLNHISETTQTFLENEGPSPTPAKTPEKAPEL